MTASLSATELADYIRVLRDGGVMSANLDLGTVKFAVVFAPESSPMPAAQAEPGGWKSPQHLDAIETPDASIP